jgi:histidine triad (HIT) family protein
MPDCVFCKIIAREIPGTIRYEDAEVLAFDDIHPVANTHILVIPKEHIATAKDLTEEHQTVLFKLFVVAKKLAQEQGLAGYKLHLNVDTAGGQDVMHLHFHLLGGEFKTSGGETRV